MSFRVAEQETADRSGPRAVSISTPSAAEVVVFACLIGFGVASIVSQSPGGAHWGGFSPAVLVGGWVVVFAALATLHANDRRRRVIRQRAAERPAAKPSRKPVAQAVVEVPAPRPRPAAAVTPAPRQQRRAPVAAPPAPIVVLPAPAPAPLGSLQRSIALSAEGRFAEAARAAHDGLEHGEEPGPLLVALSRAHLGRGQIDQAIETARDALFVARSRDSVSHLIRVLTQTRRFGPDDGPMLRRAAARHPERAMLRHALGVFEAIHGEPRAARDELLAALQLEPDLEDRRSIERDLELTLEATS